MSANWSLLKKRSDWKEKTYMEHMDELLVWFYVNELLQTFYCLLSIYDTCSLTMCHLKCQFHLQQNWFLLRQTVSIRRLTRRFLLPPTLTRTHARQHEGFWRRLYRSTRVTLGSGRNTSKGSLTIMVSWVSKRCFCELLKTFWMR